MDEIPPGIVPSVLINPASSLPSGRYKQKKKVINFENVNHKNYLKNFKDGNFECINNLKAENS